MRAFGPARLKAAMRRGDVDDLAVHLPDGVPPGEPLLHAAGARRRGGDVVLLLRQPGHGAVVDDRAVVAADDAVADAGQLHVAEPVRVEPLQEGGGVGPAHDQLAQRGDVDQAQRLVHRVDLAVAVAVVVGALPVAGPQHLAAVLGVPVVGGRALHRLVAAGRQQREAGGVVRRPRGGDADPLGIGVEAQLIGDHEPRVAVAHAPLAGAHGHGRVALGQLQRAEALVQR